MRIFGLFCLLLFFSCTTTDSIKITDSNLNSNKTYYFDYTDAYQYGFKVPSKNKDGVDKLSVTFSLPDELKNEQVYYKIFFQNETYKFPESNPDGSYNPLSEENFYGSWNNTSIGFLSTTNQTEISTSFIIHGNPRNEDKYINQNSRKREIKEEDTEQAIYNIKNNKEWYNSIAEKAKKNGISVDKQIGIDAEWLLSQKINNRWQRNPRVGDYSLLIVAGKKSSIDKIPDFIKQIGLKNDANFVNPYYYFLYGEGKNIPGLHILEEKQFVQLKASIPLKNGFYVPHSDHFLSKEYYGKYVNETDEMYKQASFTYHDTYRKDSIYNLPIKTNFFKDGFSIEDYKNSQTKYDSTDRVATWLASAQYPGKNFGYDEKEDVVWFKNPASPEGELRKEHVGFKTRHGLTYGTYTFKIKMSELLNQEQVWTGLTNAIWMLYDTQGKWNQRRICEGDGYYPYYVTPESKKSPQSSYSEIDFEILKAAEYWPKWDYKDPEVERKEPASHKDKIMVACTNWDLSCTQPENFDVGVHKIEYQDKTFDLHRWHSYQNAVTSKVPELDDELFGGEYYYFQLIWKPTEIIWKIGPEKDNLHVVGYMNDKVTSIPNNQMITVFTQEYHYSHWWPNAPFLQEDIPFPTEDLPGKLYSIEIE